MSEILEKVVLPKFDGEKYLSEGDKIYAQRAEVEAVADKVWNDGFKNIILLGIGGTEFELGPIAYQVKKYSDIDIELVNAADANTVQEINEGHTCYHSKCQRRHSRDRRSRYMDG